MSEFPMTVQERIEAQGFLGLDDGTVCRINYWLRLSPAICMVWAAGPPLPPYPLPRRFACFMATVMLVGAAWSFQVGLPLVGQVIGWTLVAAAFVQVSTGFCIPSFIYGLVLGKPSSCGTKGPVQRQL